MRPLRALTATLCLLAALPAGATAAAAPDPGGDESADVALPPPGGFMGFNDNMASELHGLSQVDYLELTRTAGGNVARTNIDWRHAEPVQGSWHQGRWSAWRAFYDRALDRGVTPLFNIGFAPGWAREAEYRDCPWFGACEYPPARSHDEEWARYAAEVARRFPKAIIEVWNEPNLKLFWESGADPQRFAELQALAYDAIKAVSPSTLVLAGGLANAQQTGDGDIALREFLDRAYEASPSLRGHMDAISFHPFPWSFDLGANTTFAKSFDDVRSAKAAHGDAATPLFVSEVGLPTLDGFVTEEQQADTMLRVYRRTMTMDDVLGIVFHRVIEPKDTNQSTFAWGYAWTFYGENPPVPKRVYCRFVAEAERSYPGCPGELPLSVTIESAPQRPKTSSSEATFEFESPNYGVTYECALDRAPFTPCWSPVTYRVDNGRHEFAVRARDGAGALSDPAKHRFRVRGR